MSARDLLLELTIEEIPAGYAQPALEHGVRVLTRELSARELEHGEIHTTATPRRLVWHVAGLAERGEDREERRIGPPVSRAYGDDGAPTKALEGFARGCGLDVDALERVSDPVDAKGKTRKGEYVAATVTSVGAVALEVLPGLLGELVAGLPWRKSMWWFPGDRALRCCRPLRGICCLFGEDVVPVRFGTVEAGRVSPGHPFLGEPVTLEGADLGAYREALRAQHVVVEREERRAAIVAQIEARTSRPSARLLDEVAMLVELPNSVEGTFDEEFLALPDCVLVSAMTSHQRYFPVYGEDGALAPRFLTVINRPSSSAALVQAGNERVLRARLADARFFFDADRKRSPDDWAARLDGKTFHAELGTLREKCERLRRLARVVAEAAFAEAGDVADAAERAGALAKFDLVTEMVGEFPDLEGRMGAIYARHAGEDEAVAAAIEAHYRPRHASDALPEGPVSWSLAVAERLDDLVGLWSVGEAPSGRGDPFALRRKALGLLRLLSERRFALGAALVETAGSWPERDLSAELEALREFLADRLRQFWIDGGAAYDMVDAVLAAGWDDVADARARLDALGVLRGEDGWAELVTVVERATNICRKAEDEIPEQVDEGLLTEDAERALHAAWVAARDGLAAHADALEWEAFGRAYREAFAAPVARYFEEVFVNCEDAALRRNRLAQLRLLAEAFRRMADLSCLAGSAG